MKTKLAPKKKKRKYQKPLVKNVFSEKEFVTKELPFVGATSVYKTYVPVRKSLQV